jgi:magnesium and cobalt exporter, CNNM family
VYHTLAGFVIMQLGRIPRAGDYFEWDEWKIEVVDMDGNRVDKVLVVPLRHATSEAGPDA